MISMSLDGEKKVRAAVEEFVEEAKTESSDWLTNMGFAISGTAQSRHQGADSQSATYVSKLCGKSATT